MKKINIQSIFIVFVASFLILQSVHSQETKLMSYNVGSSNWTTNRDSVVARITFNAPDILCIHEAGEPRRAFLESEPSLSDYRLLQTFSSAPNLSSTHIFLKENAFTVVDSGFVEMETYVGYTGLGRYIDWAKFQNISSGFEFFVYASHFVSTFGANADSAKVAQYRHANGMIQLMNQHASQNIPQFTVGDFNASLSSNVIQFLVNQTPITFNSTTITNPIALDDSWDVANPNIQKPPTSSLGSSSIDWILTTPNTSISTAIIDDQGTNATGDSPSDHYPLLVSFNLTNTTSTNEISNGFELLVFPNPAQNYVQFEISLGISQPISIQLFDSRGILVKDKEYYYSGGKQLLKIEVNDLADGIYFCRLLTSNQTYSARIIKVRSN